MNAVNTAVKIGCILLYTAGIASLAGLLPAIVAQAAGVILAIHILETIVMFKHVKKYEGSLFVSVLLSLLFGLAHWKPLVKKAG